MLYFGNDEPDGLSVFASESAADSAHRSPARLSDTDAFARVRSPAAGAEVHWPGNLGLTAVALPSAYDALAEFASEAAVADVAHMRSASPKPVTRFECADPAPADTGIEGAAPVERGLHERTLAVRLALPAAAAVFLFGPSLLVGWHTVRTRAIASLAQPLPSPQTIDDRAIERSVHVGLTRAMLPGLVVPAAQPRTARTMTRSQRPTEPAGATTAGHAEEGEPAQTDRSAMAADLLTSMPIGPVPEVAAAAPVDLVGPAFLPTPPIAEYRNDGSDEASAVRQALMSYKNAYDRLDAAGAAEIWPTVDRLALSRAFDGLQSQTLDFQSCSVTVTGTRATAECRGSLAFVRKAGDALPLTVEHQWVFTMRKQERDWRIEQVVAPQATLASQGTDEQR